MVSRASTAAVATAGVLLIAGCPSTSVYRTADPVAEGRWQVGAALGAGVMTDREQDTRTPTAQLELSVRRGVGDNLDVGAKLYTVGAEVNATWRLFRSTWSVALAPWIGATRTPSTAATSDAAYGFAGTAAIASRPLSQRWTVALGPHFGWGQFRPAGGGRANGLWIGGFGHLDATLGRSNHLSPELGVYRVVRGEVPVNGAAFYLGIGWHRDL